MKYILITLLSFTFATQITTREFEAEVNIYAQSGGIEDILEGTGLEYGKLTIVGWDGLEDISAFYISYGNNFCDGDYQDGQLLSIWCESGNSMVYEAYPYLDIQVYNYTGENITVKYWITGAFEDEDTSMGDMNNDGSLNIFDVLELVNIILEGDSGDIFDVMEIVKRV